MSSILDALQRREENKDLLSSQGARGNSLRRSTILWIIVLTVFMSSAGTAGIFYGIRMLKDDNGISRGASMHNRFQEPVETAPVMERDDDMLGDGDLGHQGRQYVEAVAAEPDSVAAYLKIGGDYYESGEYDEALHVYTKALEYYTDDARILNNIGIVMLAKGEMDKAIGYFAHSETISKDYVEPVYNIACAHALMGNQAKALSALKKASELNPQVLKWAAQDPDLGNLKGIAVFDEMIH